MKINVQSYFKCQNISIGFVFLHCRPNKEGNVMDCLGDFIPQIIQKKNEGHITWDKYSTGTFLFMGADIT
jgi:hypothetical protein